MRADNTLPKHILKALAVDPRFMQCIEESLLTDELVSNFCRLYKVELPREPRNGLEAMIDKTTGYTEGAWRTFFAVFIPFVYDCIYTRVCENHIAPESQHG
ncbi:hypothetical protein K7Y63_004163 [Serratia marcescens]